MQDTRTKWEEMFPDEPYEIVDYKTVELDIKYEEQSRYNLLQAAQRQREFYYNVSLPHYWDRDFLLRAIDRFKFLDDIFVELILV